MFANLCLKFRASLASNSVNRSATGIIRYQIDSEKGQDVRRQLAATVASHNWGLLELRAAEMSLEDVFVQLVTEEQAVAVA